MTKRNETNRPPPLFTACLFAPNSTNDLFVAAFQLAFSPFLFISRHFIYISYKYPCYACRSTLYKNLFNIFFNFFLFEKIEFHVYWLISMQKFTHHIVHRPTTAILSSLPFFCSFFAYLFLLSLLRLLFRLRNENVLF